MVTKQDLKKVTDYLYEIPKTFKPGMKVPARIYSNERLLEAILKDRSLEQAANVAMLPGVLKYSLSMPDIHQGYGFPIGGVAAIKWEGGVISPGGVGYDINCGVRVLTTGISFEEIKPYLSDLTYAIFKKIPSGVGSEGRLRVTGSDLDEVLAEGVSWAKKRGFANDADQERCEEKGHFQVADPARVSERAKKRGMDQIGTLGSGNHFLEVQKVTEIFDENAAKVMGVYKNQITIMIHSGSRGLGHQVCTDYLQILNKSFSKWKMFLPDRELIYAPLDSEEGKGYFAAMAAAANYAWANRQYLTFLTRELWREFFAGKFKDLELHLIYDVAHNIAKKEKHIADGKEVIVCMHRKGATRAFPPRHPEIPQVYQEIGQPVLIPGSMGTASFLLVGTEQAMQETFGSVCHGAGRILSRAAAKRQVRGKDLQEELAKRGIYIMSESMAGLAEEAPLAYKDIDNVVNVVAEAGLAKKVAKMQPLCVVKG